MAYFKSVEKIREDRLKEKTPEEEKFESRNDFIKLRFDFQKKIMPYISQYYGLLFNLDPINNDLWRNIELYHRCVWMSTSWRRDLKYDVTNQQFVYHIGLEYLASHIQSIVDSIHNRPEERVAILQRFVPLQFGKEYPELDYGLNHVLSFADEIGKKHDIRKKNEAETIRIAVKKLQDACSQQNKPLSDEQRQRLSDYVDGCIVMMQDISGLYNPRTDWDVPNTIDFIDDRKRTLGNIFDDYLTYRSNQKKLRIL